MGYVGPVSACRHVAKECFDIFNCTHSFSSRVKILPYMLQTVRKQNVSRVRYLLDDILSFARLSSGKLSTSNKFFKQNFLLGTFN